MSPLIAVIIAAIVLIALQFLVGMRGNFETRRIYATLLQDARRRARRSFSVIVMLERRVETIHPLLDHLYAQGYDKLQVIVVVKQTAGSKAMGGVQTYRRTQHRKGLRIVRHKRGMDAAKIAATQANGEYVVVLTAHDRMSPRFFEVTSQILATLHPNALAVRSLVLPMRTFARAFWSVTSLFRTISAGFVPSTLPSEITIVRRVVLKQKEAPAPLVYASSQFYALHSSDVQPVTSWRSLCTAMIAGLLAVAGYILLTLTLDMATAQFYAWIVFVVVEVAVFLCMLQVRGYRFVDYVNVLLFIPLTPLYACFYSIIRLAKRLFTAVRRPRLSTQ